MLSQGLVMAGVQIAFLAWIYYYVFLFFRGTRGVQILVGLALLFSLLIVLTRAFKLDELNWLISRVTVYLAVALPIIFQPEIRRALAELGRKPAFTVPAERRTAVDNIVRAVAMLAEQRVGALVAIEREIGTRSVMETGVTLDAAVTPELLASLFFPHTPLHDGGVIIRENRIVAAGCVFPLSARMDLHKKLGTRHRAAVGLSEETDAIVIVVSEESGTISVCYRGRLSRGLDEDRLRRFLSALLLRGRSTESVWKRAQEQLDLTPEGIARSQAMDAQEKSRG